MNVCSSARRMSPPMFSQGRTVLPVPHTDSLGAKTLNKEVAGIAVPKGANICVKVQRGSPGVCCLEFHVTGPHWVLEWELGLSGRATFEFKLPPGLAMPLVLPRLPIQWENRTAIPASGAGVSLPLHDKRKLCLLKLPQLGPVPTPIKGELKEEFSKDSRISWVQGKERKNRGSGATLFNALKECT